MNSKIKKTTATKETNYKKVALFHAFLKNYGGAERLNATIRDHYHADFWTGGIDQEYYSTSNQNSFSKHIFNGVGKVIPLHNESRIPLWYIIKRQLFFIFSPKIKDLLKYDIVIFSGNISWVAQRLRRMMKYYNKNTKLIAYVNTPPRLLTDQQDVILNKFPRFSHSLFKKIIAFALDIAYSQELRVMDTVITNSENIQNRLKKYTGIDSDWIFPPVDLNRFKFISDGDFYISYSRLEEAKRIPLIIDAFEKMPDKKLVICSTGELSEWVQDQIKFRKLTNITFEGMVSDERLQELVGTCLAGITIPINEDAGITQLEIMSASKPVIGVAEGGLLGTVIDGVTGVLIPANPTLGELIQGIKSIDSTAAKKMKHSCRTQAEKFSTDAFFQKFEQYS